MFVMFYFCTCVEIRKHQEDVKMQILVVPNCSSVLNWYICENKLSTNIKNLQYGIELWKKNTCEIIVFYGDKLQFMFNLSLTSVCVRLWIINKKEYLELLWSAIISVFDYVAAAEGSHIIAYFNYLSSEQIQWE